MRDFIHHPTEFPILISPAGSHRGDRATLCNIGEDGLACRLPHKLERGEPVTVQIPALQQPFQGAGRVVKCDRYATGFGLSILFEDDQETFKSKMVEQVCQIEHYRRIQRQSGRELDSESAAREWIERYSQQFSKTFSA